MIVFILKSTITLAVGLIAARLARNSAASVRHAILAATLAAAALLPLASWTLPVVSIPVPVPAEQLERVLTPAPPAAAPRVENPSTPAPAQTGRFTAIPQTLLAAGLWAAGAIAFSWSFVAAVWQLRRMRRTALPWIDAQPALAALAARGEVRRPVELLLHEETSVPITCGFRRAAVILPADAPDWDGDALRRALVHELEHVRRHDWWMHVAARLVCGFYWFNPLAWIAYRQLRLEAERACDDAVVAREEGAQYAAQLVALARRLSARHARPALAMANRSDLSRRVSAVLDAHQVRGRAGLMKTCLAAALAALAALAIAPMQVAGAGAAPSLDQRAQRAIERLNVSRLDRALVEAADEGDLAGVRALLDAGASANAAVSGDGSPLIAAARNGHLPLVTFLLDRGADPNLGVDGDGNPLIMAAREGHVQIVRLLLDRGARVDDVVDGDENALIQASAEGHLDVVRLLVARGANVNARVWAEGGFNGNGEWRSPLSMARQGRHRAVIDFLLANGASH